jgi:leucyl-tRNA synthetase
MSKSKGNTVNPDDYQNSILRFYLMFIGHYFDGGSWSDQNISGITRFVNRFKEWMNREGTDDIDVKSFREKVFNYTESFKFNKVVSEFMTLVNKERTKNLKPDIKEELISILEIYMPDIRILIF